MKKHICSFGAIVALTLAGCNTLPKGSEGLLADKDDLVGRHLIVVGKTGEPLRPVGNWKIKGGKPSLCVTTKAFESNSSESGGKTFDDYLNALQSAIQKSGKHKVMIYFHGGMNFLAGAVQNAGETAAKFEGKLPLPKEYKLDADTYPLFVCWDSPFTGYGEQVTWVRAGKTEQYSENFGHVGNFYSMATMPLHVLADIGRAVTKFPAELTQFAYNDLHTAHPGAFSENVLMEDEITHLKDDKDEGIEKLTVSKVVDRLPRSNLERRVQNVYELVTFPLRNSTLPLVDGVGVRAWDNMLRHTETMFDPTITGLPKRRNEAPSKVQQKDSADNKGVMTMLMNSFKDRKDLKITLVGHSMGAIICNRILVDFPNLNYDHIVYMGAACSVRDFETSVIPYLRKNQDSHFYNLCLHPQRESGEAAVKPYGVAIPLASRGSLLVWIDNIMGQPPSEKQRRFGIYQTSIITNRSIPSEVRPRVTLKCFPLAKDEDARKGLILTPQHHGDFSSTPYWKSSFWQVP